MLERPAPTLPSALRSVGARLIEAGHEAWWTGRTLLEAGAPTAAPCVAVGASAQALLELFPRAIPVRPKSAVVTVPTPAGPVDLVPVGSAGIEGALAREDFTLTALAFHLGSHCWLDPFGGSQDRERQRLRTPHPADEHVGARPVRALRAARWLATEGQRPDRDLEAAMGAHAKRLLDTPARVLRPEIERLLAGDGVAEALALLARTGVADALAPGARDDAPQVVAALPARTELRLAAWLRGTRVERTARQLGFPAPAVRRLGLLLAHHPVDRALRPRQDTSVRRLLRHLGEAGIRDLVLLRETELATGGIQADEAERTRRALLALETGLQRVKRAEARARSRGALAIDGDRIMQLLACSPGPTVGRALAHLAEWVDADSERNTPARLEEELARWAAAGENSA
ncbi:MAG: hypothetical protein MJE66_12960 [Proteobacteria bacterium]|nr:hypothetical protein [Pseudomonadota bacterium]